MSRPPVGGENGPRPIEAGLRLRLLVRLAAFAIVWERLWRRLWPAACIAGTFVALALFDILPRLVGWLHAGVLALFVLALVAALAWAWPAFRRPGPAAARRRLERDSGLDGRPLQAFDDTLAAGSGDLLAEALWRRHRRRMEALVPRLRLRVPDADLARHEPWGIRAGVLLLVVVGLVAARGETGVRLARAVDPGIGAGGSPPSVEVWVTPPAYTGLAPVYLRVPRREASGGGAAEPKAEAEGGGRIPGLPAGSAVLARVGGLAQAPTLVAGAVATPFEALGSGDARPAWRAETTLVQGDRIAVRAGRRDLAAWPVQVLPDSPPRVEFAEAPASAANGLLAFGWKAEDDYGVIGLALEVEPASGTVGDGFTAPLPATGPPAKSVSGRTSLDLSAAELAGAPVRARLVATDGSGQSGRGEFAEFVLPERTFSHPVARRLVAARRMLFAAGPEAKVDAAGELAAIAADPDAFSRDTVVSLALAVARARLRRDESDDALASVRDMLWQAALRLEQGDVPLAERQLAEARQRLADALRDKSPQAEIERLMDELQRAVERYLAAAAGDLAQRGRLLDAPFDPGASPLRGDDLHEMLETARELARSGNAEDALRMLADVDRLLDGIRAGLRSDASSRQLAEAQAAMRDLRALTDRQQRLLDETWAKSRGQGAAAGRDDRAGAAARAAGRASATDQRALRDDLGELATRLDDLLGSIPAPLGAADRAMRDAIAALGQGRLADGASGQARAVDALQQALDVAGQAMSERMGPAIGLGAGGGGGGSDDIFGRPPGGRRGFATGSAKIPDRGQVQRAQEIRDELRRRAAERSRPEDELEYIDRLLRPF